MLGDSWDWSIHTTATLHSVYLPQLAMHNDSADEVAAGLKKISKVPRKKLQFAGGVHFSFVYLFHANFLVYLYTCFFL